jgi:hypothetical protein
MTLPLEDLPLPDALQHHISIPVTPTDPPTRKVELYRILHPKLTEFCVSSPDFHDCDSLLSYFLSIFPTLIVSHPEVFVSPFISPFDSGLSMALLKIYTSISELELAAKSGAQTRLRILLFAIRRAISGQPQCSGVSEVIEHVLAQPFLDVWDGDLDIHPPEGKGRHNQWIPIEKSEEPSQEMNDCDFWNEDPNFDD